MRPSVSISGVLDGVAWEQASDVQEVVQAETGVATNDSVLIIGGRLDCLWICSGTKYYRYRKPPALAGN